MDKIGNVLSYKAIDNIDTQRFSNIDNSIDNAPYGLKNGFVPRTEEAYVAKEIAEALKDSKNYAMHRRIVKRITPSRAKELLSETQDDVHRRELTNNPIHNPAALYVWKVKQQLGGIL